MAAEAMKHRSDECPPLETIAAYLDDRLSGADRSRVAAHIADCETCYFVFTEAARMRRRSDIAVNATPSRIVGWPSRRVIWSAGGALATAASVMLAMQLDWFGGRQSNHSAELRALVAAVGTDRTVEPRLIGGFVHAPLNATRAGGTAASGPSPDVRIAAAQIEKATGSSSSGEALHARGLAALVVGDVDRGVATLEEAVRTSPTDAQIHSDLAAAYIARASQRPERDDLQRGLAAANRALNLNRILVEALFNRALALERLSLNDDAREAWRAYLTIDDQSGWADEARVHLRGLTETRR